jgi:hypothetical protein
MVAEIVSERETVGPVLLINQYDVKVGRKAATGSHIPAPNDTGLTEVLPSNS